MIPLIWYAASHCSEKDEFVLLQLGSGGAWGHNICYLVATFVIPINYDMQHDHVLKKMNFDLSPSSPGCGGVGDLRAKFCYHVSAFAIPFNLVCNMALF